MQNSLKNALPTIARYFSDDVGVQLIWGAEQAHTWDNKIYLPNLKEEEGVSKLALGFTAHESAHIVHSTQSVYEKASLEPPFVVKFMNVLEDVRIEDLMMKQFPVIRDWLAHTVKVVLGGKVQCENLTDAQVLHNAALVIGRARLLNQPLGQESDEMVKVMRDRFGFGRSTKVMALLAKIPTCANTEAVYSLTHLILDVLDEEEPEEQEAPQDSKPDAGDDSGDSGDDSDSGDSGQQGQGGDDSDDQSGDDAGGNQAGAANDKGGDQDQSGQGGSQAGDPQGDDSDSASGSPAGKKNDADGSSGSLKQKILSAGADECDELISDLGDAAGQVLNNSAVSGRSCSPASTIKNAVGSEMLGQETFQNGRTASAGLKQVLMGLIQGSRDCRPTARRTGKSIDGSRLARVTVGETRIFRRTEPVQRVNAAFHILLDASGSMCSTSGGTKKAMRFAEESVCALLNALEGIQGVTTGAMVFPRNGDGGVNVGVLKRHSQTVQSALRENRFGIVESGGTPLAEALWPAAGDLLAAKGERKIMVVITDGDPNDSASAKEMVDRCRDSGIDVFAVAFGGINSSTLEYVFGGGNWKFIPDLSQLRSALDQLVRSVLTQKAA
jgi:cobaltochelatase CobT